MLKNAILDPDMLITKKSERLIYLINKLVKNKKIVLKDEALYLGVSVRTLQRDIYSLEKINYPIVGQRGIYSLIDGYTLDKMTLSPQESSVLSAFTMVSKTLGNDFNTVFEGVRKHFLIHYHTPYYIKMDKNISVLPNNLNLLEQAIKEHKVIEEISIKNLFDNIEQYKDIEPAKLALYDGFWYLIGICKKKLVKLQLNRITEIKLSTKKFKENKKLLELIDESVNIWFDLEAPIKAEIFVDNEVVKYFKEKQFFRGQKLKPLNDKGNNYIMTCYASNIEEIMFALMAWLPCLRVIKPLSLANEILRRINNYLGWYQTEIKKYTKDYKKYMQ